MQAPWVFLHLNPETTVALPLNEIHRVLHGSDPDFPTFAPGASSLAETLEVQAAPDLPGVLVVLNSGDIWLVGDSSLEELPAKADYCSLSPELFRDGNPWCRGVLLADSRRAFVSDSVLLCRAGGGP